MTNLPDWIQAIAAVATLGVTWALWKVSIRQADISRRQATTAHSQSMIAERQAGISERQVQMSRSIERAYLKLAHYPPGLIVQPTQPDDPPNTRNLALDFQIKNFGVTPAEITDMKVALMVVQGVVPPAPPPFEVFGQGNAAGFLVRDDSMRVSTKFAADAAQFAGAVAGKLRLIVLAYVDYIDSFGIRHRAGYGRKLAAETTELNSLTSYELELEVTGRGYNYDRPRREGEGIDWSGH